MENAKKYIESCYNPDFTAYDFVKLFSAVNAKQGKLSFDRDSLIKYIDICKQNDEFARLLSEINLKSNGINNYSEEFEDAIFLLKMANILYTVSPEKNSNIFISENIPFSEIVSKKKEYFEDMITFVDNYSGFEKGDILQERNCMTCQNGSCKVENSEKIGLDEFGNPQGTNCVGYINNELTDDTHVKKILR